MQKLKYLKYFSIFLKCLASTDSDVCINVTEGTKGTIKSIDREYVTCPAWYQVWKGFEKCYPAREFNWCWQLRNVSKLLLQTRYLIGGEITDRRNVTKVVCVLVGKNCQTAPQHRQTSEQHEQCFLLRAPQSP